MFTQLTQKGYEELFSLNIDNRITFTKYVVGRLTQPVDLSDAKATVTDIAVTFTPSPVDDTSPAGTIVGSLSSSIVYDTLNFVMSPDKLINIIAYYEHDATTITKLLVDDEKTIFKMFVPPEFMYFKVNCVVIYAEVAGEEFPFLVSYSLDDNPKFSSETNRFGTKYFFMLQLDTYDRERRFDFSALAEESVDFFEIENHYNLSIPPKLEYNQLLVNNHTNLADDLDYRLLVINSQEQFFGVIAPAFDVPYQEDLTLNGDVVTLNGESVTVINNPNKDIILTN